MNGLKVDFHAKRIFGSKKWLFGVLVYCSHMDAQSSFLELMLFLAFSVTAFLLVTERN
jgi:hypothetical protein